jgi:hypothetical protein
MRPSPGKFLAVVPASVARSNPPGTLAVAARPTWLFAAAYALSITPHESVHALTGYLLGFNATIFQMWVNPDRAAATPHQLAIVAAAGPLFSLIEGAICWRLYASPFRLRPSGLIFLLLALVGIDSFLGPMAGAALGGDFHMALQFLGAPGWVGLVVSCIGIVFLAIFMFRMGWELAGWVPREFGRINSVLCATVFPATLGTLLILILYWPLPGMLINSTIAGTAIWIFAVIGAAWGFKRSQPGRILHPWTRADLVIAIAAVVMVRVFAMGIRLAH